MRQGMDSSTLRPKVNVLAAIAAFAVVSVPAMAQWHQWGGPDRDFRVNTSELAASWPKDGPAKLWQKELGDGYSTIVADGDMLYTMYRKGADEFTIALDAKAGATIWRHRADSPITKDMSAYGPGPYATPLISGNRLLVVGTRSVLQCFDKKTGKVLWQHDFIEEFDAVIQGFGFSSSPILYNDSIILPVGRKVNAAASKEEADKKSPKMQQQSIMAFHVESGSLLWDNKNFAQTKHDSTYSSPIMINFGGQDQLVLFMTNELAGLNPLNGERIWGIEHKTKYDENMSTPVWDGRDTLFCSAAYDSGARGVRLSKKDGKTVAEELWYTRKMRVLHGNVVRIGDHVYGTSGDFGPTFLAGINMKTGRIAWRERGFKKATCLAIGDRIIILDEDGKLALAKATPEQLTVQSSCELKLNDAWATPTLIGKTLFIRDRSNIMAFDLG